MNGTQLTLAREMEGLFIIRDSLQAFFKTLVVTHGGRCPNEVRAMKQAAESALAIRCPDGKIEELCLCLGTLNLTSSPPPQHNRENWGLK